MTATIFYDGTAELALLNVTFTLSGVATDPAAVSCVITDPSGVPVTHTYLGTAPADIAKISTGTYQLSVPCSPSVTGADGLWSYTWVAAGTVNDIQPGTWRVFPSALQPWYIGLEEFKSRLGITDTSDDFEAQVAIQSACQAINDFCGRHFNRITETRTFMPHNIWLLEVDDIVPGSAITVNMDIDGDGIFETPMVNNVDFQLRLGNDQYNINASGLTRPYRQLQIIQTGKWFPFTWPYTHLDRVQVQTTWGWSSVPPPVTQGAFLLAPQLFKLKDAPFGTAGNAEFGVLQIVSNPMLVLMLSPYVNGRRKVGV
jgi:hypothetical protein